MAMRGATRVGSTSQDTALKTEAEASETCVECGTPFQTVELSAGTVREPIGVEC